MSVAKSYDCVNTERSPHFGMMQQLVDSLFAGLHVPTSAELALGLAEMPTVRRLDVILTAESLDLPEDLLELVNMLPPGDYTRQRLCNQLNSSISGHAWGLVYGTVE